MVFDSFYMLLFGVIMILVIDNKAFLAAFNFNHENDFMTLVLFTYLYLYSVDIPLRVIIHWQSRKRELEADRYSVKLNYGNAAYSALVRNYAKNKDILFTSKFKNTLLSTHPMMTERIEYIDRLTRQ